MAKPLELDAGNFDREVLEENTPVVVDFWSPTCPHCLQLNPHFEIAAETHKGEVKFVKIAAQDQAMPLFQQYGVRGVPTLVLFQAGKEIARQSGSKTSEQITAWLRECL